MARPKKQQWPIGGEPKVAACIPRVRPITLAAALVDINNMWFDDPKARSKDPNAVEVLSGGQRIDRDFPALYINEQSAVIAWWTAMEAEGKSRTVEADRKMETWTFVWVDPPELIKLQITIMDMRDRTHRVGNDRYVVRSRHVVVKAEQKDEAA